MIISHEGWELHPYPDQYGNLTIGAGRNLTANGISSREAFDLLDHDLDACITDLSTFPWFLALDDVRQRVIVDMRYNLGPTRFRTFTRLPKALAAQDYQAAAVSMRESRWARQVPARAKELILMMQTGEDA